MENLWDVNNVVEFTKLPKATIRFYCSRACPEQRRLPVIHLGGRVRFRPSEIEAWIGKQSDTFSQEADTKSSGFVFPEEGRNE